MPRPRIYPIDQPKSEAQRRMIERVKAAGGKRLCVNLSPKAAHALQQITATTGETSTQAVNRMLISAAS